MGVIIYNENKNFDNSSGGSLKAPFDDHLGGYTVNITGINNWVRGVHFEKTQKMHLYINGGNNQEKGQHNTVSGCYFHESYSYGDNGHGYGVCLSGRGATKFNLIENNVFYKLRHSIVLQYEVSRNVIAYNSSIDSKGWWLWRKGDIILHCAEGDSTGPNLNLFEGNIGELIEVDHKDEGYHNNPYNTYFRNRAIYRFQISRVEKEYKQLQCAQNVVGCNMDPNWDPINGRTFRKLKKWGWKNYYDRWWAYKKLPDDQKSYFKSEKPVYFTSSWDWPFMPKRSNVNPARDRWNVYHEDFDNTKIPVSVQGFTDYDLDCADEKIIFENQSWNNAEENYGAEELITLDNCQVQNGSTLEFKVGEKIILTNNTHIYPGNNVRFSYGGNFCFFNKEQKNVKSLKTVTEKDELTNDDETRLSEEIKIYPNPNNGSFTIQCNFLVQKGDIQIFDIFGNELEFLLVNRTVKLSKPYNGILFLHILLQNRTLIEKITVHAK